MPPLPAPPELAFDRKGSDPRQGLIGALERGELGVELDGGGVDVDAHQCRSSSALVWRNEIAETAATTMKMRIESAAARP